MPDFGAPVAANIQAPQFTSTLSDLIGLKQKQQALQAGALGIQQQEQNLQSSALGIQKQQGELPSILSEAEVRDARAKQTKRLSELVQSGVDDMGNSLKNAAGEIDPAKTVAMAGRVAPLAPEIAQNVLATHTARVGLQSALLVLDQNQRANLMGPIQAIATNPNDPSMLTAARKTVASLAERRPELAGLAADANLLLDHVEAAKNPAQRAQMANAFSAMFQGGQQVQTQPQAGQQDLGAVVKTGTTAPPVAGGAFTPTATAGKSLAPQIVVGADGIPRAVGGGGGAPAAPQPGIASGPSAPRPQAPGNGGLAGFPSNAQVGAQTAAAGDMVEHFRGLNTSAQALPITNALTKTIESLAPSAFTGVGGDKKQYVAGLWKALHLPGDPSGDAQTDTNLLNKAMAQLNLNTPAASVAAQHLTEAAQPNNKMDPEAIKEAAGTIAGQIRMNVAQRNFLNNIRYANGGAGNPEQYQQARQWFENSADPRIWQYEELAKRDAAGAKAFINRQPDRADLVLKAGELEKAGFFK